MFPQKVIARWRNHPKQFEKVAEVEARNLDHVWGIAQNVEDSWTKRPEVKWCKRKELRSTSIGDIIVQKGEAWLIVSEGFTKIPKSKSEAQPVRG